MNLRAVIFDLDGVIVSTDELHYLAWKKVACEEGVPFERADNERLRGVSRMASLDIMLEKSVRVYTAEQKAQIADRKNEFYRHSLGGLSQADILPGVAVVLRLLRAVGLKLAIGSSSKNAKLILRRIGLVNFFDAVVDGTDIVHSKPNPEVFLLAAARLGMLACECAVVEDAEAGIDAANAGGFLSIGIGSAAGYAKAGKSLADIKDLPAVLGAEIA